jgi:hypothetical protein
MPTSLKRFHRFKLYALVALNLAAFVALLHGSWTWGGQWSGTLVVPAGVGLILIEALNAQLSAAAKSRLVFLKWKYPLPGHRAFTHYAKSDPRIDIAALQGACGRLPTNPKEQNLLWYKMFKAIDTDPAVLDAHEAYLIMRDAACLTLMILPILGVAALLKFGVILKTACYIGLLFLQFFVFARAARNYGRRLVTTVLALTASQAGGPR